MKQLLITIAALVLVGCGESNPPVSIHEAAQDGNIEALKRHLDTGTDVNLKDDSGATPLHEASSFEIGDTAAKIVELLIANGADVNAKYEILVNDDLLGNSESFTYTPLDSAIQFDNTEIADLLRKHGAKTGAELKADESIHIAAESGNIEALKKHLSAGGDVNAKDERGKTPLHFAADYGHREIAKLLIAEGADLNVRDMSEMTALQVAMFANSTEMAELLINKGTDLNIYLYLHNAAGNGYKEIAELLIAGGANVNAMSHNDLTPLDAAADDYPKIADLLRKHGGKTGEELKAEGK